MFLTNDQYYALSKLERWYNKYNKQIIEISGTIGTGIWILIQNFIDRSDLDPREVMYLTYNQKQVLDLAYKKFHSYYINGILYKYNRIIDFNSLSVINKNSKKLIFEWKKELKTKIDKRYKLMIVFDSSLLNYTTIKDLSSFGLPIILIRDPMLIPSPDSYVFIREPDLELMEIHPNYMNSPIIYFANKVINNKKLIIGNYDNVSIISKKCMNLYNLRSSDMNITINKNTMNIINNIYRNKILKVNDNHTILNEKVIVNKNMYNRKIVNNTEKNIKLYLTKGTIGYISKINKHAVGTRYVPIELRPEYYHESFSDLILDRHYLNKIDQKSNQLIPDETIEVDYAYALTPDMARLSYWDKVTLLIDDNDCSDEELQKKLLYTAITRSKKSLTIIF